MHALSRRRKRAQSLVIVALSATALFGIIALGLDAGRLYFQRRDVQNAADAGALAGAQELLPPDGNAGRTTAMITKANCQASLYAIQGVLGTPTDGTNCTSPSPNYQPNGSGFITETATNQPVTVTVWTPSRGNSNEIHVRVSYNVPLTFAAVIGFTNSAVVADAYAHGLFFNNQYAVFGFQAGPGGGNTVQFDQNGYAQIDNGNNGLDICNPSPQGRVVSNSKWHAPNPNPQWLNVNGQFQHLSAADTHAIRTYWYQTVSPVPIQEQAPNYEATVNPADALSPTFAGGVWHIHAGAYGSTLNIPGSLMPGSKATDTYIFDNGLYLFKNGASFNITGGTVSNTSTGRPLTTLGTYSDLPVAADGITNGVEFIFDQGGGFSASTSGTTSPSVFFVAPDKTIGGVTNHIAFYVRQTDTNLTPWSETIDGTKPTYGVYPFQVWGTVFIDVPNATATIQAVSWWQNAGNPGAYAVVGELISPRVNLLGGNLALEATTTASVPNGTPNTPGCTGGYVQNPAGLLVQYNPAYAPQFHGYAYLVK
jgi:Flp pilus assembly protein TadG